MVSWTDDPFARCIARAPIGDQRETVIREIKRPLDKRVFFAGEHTDERPGPGGMDDPFIGQFMACESGNTSDEAFHTDLVWAGGVELVEVGKIGDGARDCAGIGAEFGNRLVERVLAAAEDKDKGALVNEALRGQCRWRRP